MTDEAMRELWAGLDNIIDDGDPRDALAIVADQAEDEGLWFRARTAPEAYLQQELRRLHRAIEAEAALSTPAGLNVERLARALRALCDEGDKPFMYFDDENEGRWGAESILRMLARED